MRCVPALIALALCLGAVSCGGEDPAPARPVGAFAVPETPVVGGRTVEVVDEGPWRIRRVAGARHSSDGRTRRRELALDAPGEVVPVPSADPAEGMAEMAPGAREPADPAAPTPSQTGAPRLRAGATDDNAHFDAFLEFLATWVDQDGVADRYDALDVTDRRFFRVFDAEGRPVPGARVHVLDEPADRVVWSGRTHGDGRVAFYPQIASERGAVPAGGWHVEVRHGAASHALRWDGQGRELAVRLDDAASPSEPVAIDVGILLDTTGSMSDEMARIKSTLLSVTARLHELGREFDLQIGAVLYRDLGDEYVTMRHPLTADVEAFSEALRTLGADGGGDTPESLNQGLAEAVGRLDWREGAAHVLFLIADAPPHMDYESDVRYGQSLRAAVDRGVRIHAVAASGLDSFGTLVFRQIAQFARGKFIFIEYGTTEGTAAAHGVKHHGKGNNLDDILYEQIRAELDGWGRPDPVPAAK